MRALSPKPALLTPIEGVWRLKALLNKIRRSVRPRLSSSRQSTRSVSCHLMRRIQRTSSAACQTRTVIMRYHQLQFEQDKMVVLIQCKLTSTERSTGSWRWGTRSPRFSQLTRMATLRPTSHRIRTISTFTRAKTTSVIGCRTSIELTLTRWTSWRSTPSLCSRLRTCAPRDDQRIDLRH